MIMFKCLRGSAPAYLADYCTITSVVSGRSALRSAAHGDIIVPSHQTDWGLRSFAVDDPSSWNALPIGLRSSLACLDGAEVSASGLKIGRSPVQISPKTNFSIMTKLPVKSTGK